MTHKMRIALVLETSGGGSGRHVLDLAEGLAAMDHDVTVIWSSVRATEDFIAQLHAISGLTLHSIDMHRAVTPKDYSSLQALRSLMRSLPDFDILHAHSSKAGALVRMLPKSIRGKRIYTPHAFRTMDPTLGQPQRVIYATIERILAPRSDQIIAVSQAESDHAQTLGIPAEKLSVIVNGAELPKSANRETARDAMGVAANDIVFGFVGRLEPQKDPVRFVQAINVASQQIPKLRGVVIGDGALRADAETANIYGSATFLGWQDAPALMPGLDAFVMTSTYEAMPYTLIEALHAGLPIVTSAIGGADEAVQENQNGHVIPLTAPAKNFADTFVDLARNTKKRMSFGTTSKQRAERRTIPVMTKETIAVYTAALRN